jgi:hypothetical protein
MVVKRILCPARVRRVPPQFSWVDHRLVREGHLSRCSHEALALYLFLVTVADAQGLSYYSDRAAGRLLGMDSQALAAARRELRRAALVAYEYPLYQVLSLDGPAGVLPAPGDDHPRRSGGDPVSLGEVLRQAMGEMP